MPRILDRLATDHDWGLVALAALACLLVNFAAVALLRGAQASEGRQRHWEVLKAGLVAGLGGWATHALAMLAYDPGVSVAFSLALTALSLGSAVAITSLGFAISVRGGAAVLIGGAVSGCGLAIMQHLGVRGIEMPAYLLWRPELAAASVAVGIALTTAGIGAAATLRVAGSATAAAAMLTLGAFALHVLTISALDVTPDPTTPLGVWVLSRGTLALAVAAAGLVVAGLSLSAVLTTPAPADESLASDEAPAENGQSRTETSLPEQNRWLHAAVANMSQGLCMFDAAGRLRVCNQRYREMYDLSADRAKPGSSLLDLLQARRQAGTFSGDVEQYADKLIAAMAAGEPGSSLIELADGRVVVVVNRPMPGGGWVATHEDVTDLRRAEQRVAYLAHHDTLTELANRTTFIERLASAIESAKAAGSSFGLLSIDLDRFKEVNDVFGHGVGDALLREVSKRLRKAAGDAFVARLGGDEFTVVVTEGAQPTASATVAERIATTCAGDFEVDGRKLRTGSSIGIAVYPGDGADPPTLLGNADAALSRAKADGRGSIRFFEADMDLELRERRAMQHELRAAIENSELVAHFQPQALVGGEIIGFEALVRWRHPTRGMVPPGAFIPLAEESGLIIPLGEWILREACREAASWPKPLQVAINLSPVQFEDGELPALVHRVLLETGLPPERLELEITEGVLIGDFSRALSLLRRLKLLGVRIAMDDFGTGYSSLSYLQAFPFDKIKIDRAFISNLETNAQSAPIVRAVIGLAHGLGLPVAAEGVETAEQLAFLARESCDEIQGFLIGRPRPIEDYGEIVGRDAAPAPGRAIVG